MAILSMPALAEAHATSGHGHGHAGVRASAVHRRSTDGRKHAKRRRSYAAAERRRAERRRHGRHGHTMRRSRTVAGRLVHARRADASACANVTITPEAGNLEAVREATLCLIDRERAAHGESPLRLNARLAHAAQGHSENMAQEGYFAHESPSGSTPLDRMRAAGYIPGPRFGYEVGENLAWGTLWLATPKAIVEAWMASPEHRANILDPHYRDTGLGIVPEVPTDLGEGQPGAIYTQDFGVLIPA